MSRSSRLQIAEDQRPDFTPRLNSTYMTGIYLAVNAIEDLFLLVEGPDCVHMKTQYVQGNHDWLSTLTSVSGFHRVANTALHPAQMSGSREESVEEALLKIASRDAVPAVALTSMPMAFITGADYDRLTRNVSKATGKPVVAIPGKSLSGDWLDGYAEALLALATSLDLPQGSPKPDNVAIVGSLFDRNEEDNAGNVRELCRILRSLDLEPVSIWLSGGAVEQLAAIKDAATIISLPYGRRAARRMAKRLGARLIEAELPFGLPATEAWVRTLGRELSREQRAEALIDREAARIAPKLEWVVPFLFEQRKIAYVGDPHLLPGLSQYAELLGMSVELAVITNRPTHTIDLAQRVPGVELLVNPTMRRFIDFLMPQLHERDIHLLVANNHGLVGGNTAVVELGFPSFFNHSLYDRPYLGFGGALAFADTMANAIRMLEVQRAQAQREGGRVDPRPDDF